jgi:hypothetical protein
MSIFEIAAQMGEMKWKWLDSTERLEWAEMERYDNDCDYAINTHNTTMTTATSHTHCESTAHPTTRGFFITIKSKF